METNYEWVPVDINNLPEVYAPSLEEVEECEE